LAPLFKTSANYSQLNNVLKKTKTEKLEKVFFKSLKESTDRIIISLMELKGKRMLSTENLASSLNYSKSTIRKLVERGKLISVIRGKAHYSHPSLFYTQKK